MILFVVAVLTMRQCDVILTQCQSTPSNAHDRPLRALGANTTSDNTATLGARRLVQEGAGVASAEKRRNRWTQKSR